MTLFDVPAVELAPPEPTLSAGQRLTLRNQHFIDAGVHPATRRPLAGNDQTCGTCTHHHAYRYHNGLFHKCDQHRLGETHSAASDVRVGWPACELWGAVT